MTACINISFIYDFRKLCAMALNEDSPEARAFQEHYSTLVSAIQDPDTLADQLFFKRILSQEVLVGLQTPGLSNLMKSQKILQCVFDQIVFVDSSSFWVFTDVLKCEAYTEPLSNMLEATCCKFILAEITSVHAMSFTLMVVVFVSVHLINHRYM